jgi:hypothetical protein
MPLTKTQVAMLEATGTPNSGNFLRGDGSWNAPASGITAMTAVASTSGTSIDFTSIPSGVKRITVMLNGVSTNGTSNWQVQLGDSGGVETTGYAGAAATFNSSPTVANATTGFVIPCALSAITLSGTIIITNISGNIWIASGYLSRTDGATAFGTGGNKTLSDVLDRVRITTVNGTDTFDAGSINILYEF